MTTLFLIEPDGASFKVISKADLLKERGTGSGNDEASSRSGSSNQNWAPLALAEGKLLIRDQSRLMCIKVVK
jgi:hypothetical protein